MPELDRLARERRSEGLRVFGISTEDEATQRNFETEVLSVDYPLLLPGAYADEVMPELFTETARYPAQLPDRPGRAAAPRRRAPTSLSTRSKRRVDRVLALPGAPR